MSQSTYTIGANQSGIDYRTADNAGKLAIVSSHKGSSRPAYAVAGIVWLDDTSNPTWTLKLYDGTDDITIGTFNTTSNYFHPANFITNQTAVTPAVGDSIAISDVSDSNNIKKCTITNLLELIDDQAITWTAAQIFSNTVTINESPITLSNNDVTAYNATATDGQVSAGASVVIKQSGANNNAISQLVFQCRPDAANWSRIGTTGGLSPEMFFCVDDVEQLRITNTGNLQITGGGTVTSDTGNNTYTSAAINFLEGGTGVRSVWIRDNTTAATANVFISDTTGGFLRSTSSLKYKHEIEDIWPGYADLIYQLKPIYYKSKSPHDNPNWSHVGFGAEDVAKIIPQLVRFKTHEHVLDDKGNPVREKLPLLDDKGQHIRHKIGKLDKYGNPETRKVPLMENGKPVFDIDGTQVYTDEIILIDGDYRYFDGDYIMKELDEMEPEGVQYDRLTVLLVSVVQRQKEEIDNLKSRLDKIEGKL